MGLRRCIWELLSSKHKTCITLQDVVLKKRHHTKECIGLKLVACEDNVKKKSGTSGVAMTAIRLVLQRYRL